MKINHIVLLFLLISSCSTDNSINTTYNFEFPENLIVLGHKGSGTFNEFGNNFRDNSLASILHAVEQLDGAEFDIQMSSDSTLWLFHDHTMLSCKGELENIAMLSDSIIRVNSECNYGGEVARLSDLISPLKEFNTTSKTISLDLKVLQNPESIKTFGGEAELAMFIAEKINTLTSTMTSYDLFIEVPFSSQVHIMESITGKTTFLIHNSFEYLRQSLRMNHSSPIHHYYEDVSSLFHDYGQQSLLWVVNSADEMMNALALNPTAIQTDNIPMVQFFKALNQGGQASAAVIQPPLDSISDFLVLEEQLQPITQDCLYEVDFGANRLDGVQLVISGVDNLGESTKWTSIPIYKKNHFFFLGEKEHQHLETQQYKIYLWHPEGEQIVLKTQIKLSKVTLVQQ